MHTRPCCQLCCYQYHIWIISTAVQVSREISLFDTLSRPRLIAATPAASVMDDAEKSTNKDAGFGLALCVDFLWCGPSRPPGWRRAQASEAGYPFMYWGGLCKKLSKKEARNA